MQAAQHFSASRRLYISHYIRMPRCRNAQIQRAATLVEICLVAFVDNKTIHFLFSKKLLQ